jgi:aminopeptidase
MEPEIGEHARRLAEVAVRVGLNLQPGQRLLIAEPFLLQGVVRSAAPLVAAVERAALDAGASRVETIWGDEAEWRRAASGWPDRRFREQLQVNTQRLVQAVADGAALLFLQGAHPELGVDLPVKQVAKMRAFCGELYGRVAPDLLAGATNWTAVPAPAPEWAHAVFPELPDAERLVALWRAVGAACRTEAVDAVASWREHVAGLERRRDELNTRRVRSVRLMGPGTDLTLALPRGHRWCAASLVTMEGLRFVPNLPTEEVFTAPDQRSAEGRLRVARAVCYGGSLLEGVELEFHGGSVVRATARRGAEVLERLLDTDRGASRLGEVALVPQGTAVARMGRCFLHPLFDENALPHVALGDAYGFTADASAAESLNRSGVHVDLPVDAEVVLT